MEQYFVWGSPGHISQRSSSRKLCHGGIIYVLTQRYAGQTAYGIPVSLEWLSNDSKMESTGCKTGIRAGEPPPVAYGK
jgi:hypothetical protein